MTNLTTNGHPNAQKTRDHMRLMKFALTALALAAISCSTPPPEPQPKPAFLQSGANLEIAAAIAFNEGPAADAEGAVYFTEITGNRILKYLPDGTWTEFRNPSRRANGLAFDAQGRLLACEGGGRQLTRTDLATGELEVLATAYEGKRLNSPNDLVVATNGRIYFTDPRYGDQSGRELATEDVYMVDTDGTLTRVATAPEIAKPNGIALSPDQSTLYVADTQPGPPSEARIMAFAVNADGALTDPRAIYSFGEGRGIDGMAIDVEGNLYGAAGHSNNAPENRSGVYVVSPKGELLGVIEIPEDSATNCTFGGPDLKTLYVTAGKTLFQIRTENAGFLVYPPPK